MATSDVWAGSDTLGQGDHAGLGAHPNQAFSIDVVLRNGIAFVQEAPGVAIAAGVALIAVNAGPSVVSIPLQVVEQWATENNDAALMLGSFAARMGLSVVSLFLLPIGVLFRAGLITSAAKHAMGEEIDVHQIYRNVEPAVRLGLYSIAVYAITLTATLILMVPVVVVGVALGVVLANSDVQSALVVGGLGVVVLVALLVALSLVTAILSLGGYLAAAIDEWPVIALQRTWDIARSAPITLLITLVIMGVCGLLSFLSLGCLVGVVLLPLFSAVFEGGLAISYLLYSRPMETTQQWEFFKRNPPPFA